MIKFGIVIACGLLLGLLALAIRRYRRNPNDINVMLVAWVFVCCITLATQILIMMWAYGLRGF